MMARLAMRQCVLVAFVLTALCPVLSAGEWYDAQGGYQGGIEPIRLHPDNAHYFRFRGASTILMSAVQESFSQT